ncbi:glutamate racemase [Lactiplantibacillus fabifermentans]|uniref:Glutamate racemase n=2 Tax=Lactiplantibacillus fabifermentans TaxID=483011 RepID=W6T7I3_9LACO|nr:glutamate racemase [Lactiplantibacillus fabifermentans]ETY73828.1 glutamate racemase [Lactiplantibacillus fabifermentans T30PCM01]
MSNEHAIGFMDSGVGGLTVVKQALKQLPRETVYFIGDQARLPYGPRPSAQVREFSWQMASFLLKKDIKMLVIACNTATAAALPDLRAKLDIPVIGVISPGSRAALKASPSKRIGVIATEGTIKSNAYRDAIMTKDPDATVFSEACPKFVPLVESNEYRSTVAKRVVAESLKPFKTKNIDTLVLGCTHYPLLRPLIQNVIGEEVTLIDSGAETVNGVSFMLDYLDIANTSATKKYPDEYYTTGSADQFATIAKDWLDLPDFTATHIDLGGE